MGGGTLDWIPATSYPSKGVTFKWNENATHILIRVYFQNNAGNNGYSLIYIDLSNPTYSKDGNIATNILHKFNLNSSGFSVSYDATNKEYTLSHVNYGWSDGYVLPLNIGTDYS